MLVKATPSLGHRFERGKDRDVFKQLDHQARAVKKEQKSKDCALSQEDPFQENKHVA